MRRVFREVPERPVFPEFDNKNSIMKNIITVAALLAAGTAFANAEIVLTTELVGTTATTDDSSVSANIGTVYGLDSSGAKVESQTIEQQTAAQASSYIFAPKINIGLDSTNASNPVVGNGWTTTLTFSLGEGESWNDVFSELSSVSVDFVAFNSSGKAQNNEITANYKLALTCGESTWEMDDWTSFTTIPGNNSAGLGDSSNSNIAATGTFVFDSAFTALGNNPISLSISVKRPEIPVGTYIGVSYVKFNGSVVPEPSAFGLLAGAGALALVAARRRRRRA